MILEKRFDIAIIGTGPGGLSAAINAKIRNKSIILFGSKELSKKLEKAPKINNYLGSFGLSGQELKENFLKHIKAMEIEITEERINTVYAMGEYFSIMSGDKVYEASSVILATGIEFTKPIKGELEFLGRGVGYCATCDAPLYKGKTVVIVGYNKEAEEEANFVNELTSKLYYVPMRKSTEILNPEIEVVEDVPVEVLGAELVNKIKLRNRDIDTDGVFVLKDSVPPSELVPGLEIIDGHIATDKSMKTNIPGLYAAGDCSGKPYQLIKAAGEGLTAALNAVSYIDELKQTFR